MDALFWVGQVVWICILACGAYVSFSYFDLADARSARTVKPEKQAAPAAQSRPSDGDLTSLAVKTMQRGSALDLAPRL